MWKVVPISKHQLLDVRDEDLLENGHFRRCETYRGGGGYDQFPVICERRLGKRAHKQFVVQLYGCNLDCSYCYVTRSGVWGKPVLYTTQQLVEAFVRSGEEVFHLMGGAPALYIEDWPELIKALPPEAIFHSDLLLTEKVYRLRVLDGISQPNCLYAVDIKGVTPENYLYNTRKPMKVGRFWYNLDQLVKYKVPFYLTFTNPDKRHYTNFVEELTRRYSERVMDDAFIIDLVDYNAAPFVDVLP